MPDASKPERVHVSQKVLLRLFKPGREAISVEHSLGPYPALGTHNLPMACQVRAVVKGLVGAIGRF